MVWAFTVGTIRRCDRKFSTERGIQVRRQKQTERLDMRPPARQWGPRSLRRRTRLWLRETSGGGSTPLAIVLALETNWERRDFRNQNEQRSVTSESKCVTYVLNHKCYLCPDCAPSEIDSRLQTLDPRLFRMRSSYFDLFRPCSRSFDLFRGK